MKPNKSLALFSLLVLISMLFAACAPAATPSPASPTQPSASVATEAPDQESSGAVEITYEHKMTTPEDNKYIDWLVAKFNDQYKGKIHVTWSGVDDETYTTKLPLLLRSDNPPDVFYWYEG